MHFSKIILILVTLFCTLEHSYADKYKKLDKYFDAIEKNERGMGSVAIIENDNTIYSRHFGFKKEPAKPLYRIGSISKVYTAVIIIKLIEEGKLSFDTKLSSYYGKIKNADKITIEHLLRHRTGLPNFTSEKDYYDYFEKMTPEKKQLAKFNAYAPVFAPGEKYQYSNTNYVLLSYIAQKISGKSFSTLLSEYISGPLNLVDTFIYQQAKPKKDEVLGYAYKGSWETSSNTHESVPLGAGAIVSTPKEVGIFLRSLLKGKLISSTHLKQMKLQKDGYGLGLITFPYNKKVAYGHTGGIDNFRSMAGYMIEDDVAFVQLMNAVNMSFNDISIALLNSYYGAEIKIPSFKKQIRVPLKILQKYVGTYSGDSFPLDLTISIKKGVLYLQATGQDAIPFEANSSTSFSYPSINVSLLFKDEGNTLEFTQGKKYILKKNK